MKANVNGGPASASPRTTAAVTGGQIFVVACTLIIVVFALAAGGAVSHFDTFRVPALIGDAQAGR